MNDFERIRYIESYRLEKELILPLLKQKLRRLMAGSQLLPVEFQGFNPMTGVPVTIIFNEPLPNKSKIISFNYLTDCYFYSEDAGLTWERIEKNESISYFEKADLSYGVMGYLCS